jgi:hypothetical protein
VGTRVFFFSQHKKGEKTRALAFVSPSAEGLKEANVQKTKEKHAKSVFVFMPRPALGARRFAVPDGAD